MSFYTNVATSGNKVLLREYDPDKGRATKRRVDFNPCVFLPSNSPTGWKSIDGHDLKRVEFEGSKEFWDFKKNYSGIHTIYGDINVGVQFISEHYPDSIEFQPEQIRIVNLDIETDHDEDFPDPEIAPMEVTAISLYDRQNNVMNVYGLEYEGCGGWHPDKRWHGSRYLMNYVGFDTEKELLEQFVRDWEKNHPDIVTGWFIDGFDIPYLINRIERILGEGESRRLSPWKQIRERQARNQQSSQGYRTIYTMLGISSLDYMVQYKKYSYTPQESYKLDHIAYAELGDRKLDYSEVKNLPELYRTDYQKFIDYNIKDVDIVERLDDKKGFLNLIVFLAYYAKINYDDVASPVRIWDSMIYNHLKEQGIQVPPDKSFSKKEKYEGAYVKDPISGRYNWVVSIDLASEYPSLMRGINISPDVFCDETPSIGREGVDALLAQDHDLDFLKLSDHSMAANGTQYTRDKQGFMGILLTKLFEGRKADKRTMLDAQDAAEHATGEEKDRLKHKAGIYHVLQYSKKVLLNSAYGALGNEFFRWFDIRLAEAVTTSGQLAIRWAEKAVNEYFNEVLGTNDIDYVIYIDTDSIYVNADPIVQKFMPDVTDKTKITDKLDLFFDKKVSQVVKNAYNDLYKYMNHREQLMFMDREVIADVAVFCTKKHYFMRVYDSEGIRYAEPKIKIMGMGFIKSNVPEYCRNECKDVLVPIALDGTNADFVAALNKFEEEFKQRPLEEIACVTGVSSIRKHMSQDGGWLKGAPIGSKSAIIYNRLHQEHNLGTSYPKIAEGDKIRYLYLNKINPLGEETIGFVDYLPDEFDLRKHVDVNMQFEKTFMSPVNEILSGMNWERKITSNINDWFNL